MLLILLLVGMLVCCRALLVQVLLHVLLWLGWAIAGCHLNLVEGRGVV